MLMDFMNTPSGANSNSHFVIAISSPQGDIVPCSWGRAKPKAIPCFNEETALFLRDIIHTVPVSFRDRELLRR